MFDKEKFGVKLRHLRKLKNCTQEQIASDIGCLRSTLSNIERGKKAPSLDMVIALGSYLNVSIDYLLGTSDFPQPIPAHIQGIINKAKNPEELLNALNKVAQTDNESKTRKKQFAAGKFDEVVKGLDNETLEELQKYIAYLKVRQTLSPKNDESSAGSDSGTEKEGIR